MNMFEKGWFRACSWGAVAVCMSVIFWLSGHESLPLPVWFTHQEKLYHFLGYNILGFLIANATGRGSHKQRFWIAVSLASVYGITDEFHQSFVPGLGWSFWHWAADTAGGWAGAYLYLRSETVLRRSNAPTKKQVAQ